MIRIQLFIIGTIYLFQSVAQDVMLSIDTISRKEQTVKYRYHSIDKYDQKTLIKLGATGGSQNIIGIYDNDFPFDFLALEHKISNRISLEGTYYFPIEDFRALSGRLRYYLNFRERANNLSGKYLALEYSNAINSSSFDSYLGRDKALFLQFGRQMKKSTFGYADFRLYSSYQFGSFNNSLNFGFNVTLGTSWGPTGKLGSNTTSDQRPENSNEEYIITIENPTLLIGELFDLISVTSSIEREIFLKNMSIVTQFSFSVARQEFGEEYINLTNFLVNDELRKYFGPLQRPNKDASTRSFSGLYAGAGISGWYTFRKLDYKFTNEGLVQRTEKGSVRAIPYLSVGYQERLSKRYFFDFFMRYFFYTRNNFSVNTKGPSAFSLGTRVGLSWGR